MSASEGAMQDVKDMCLPQYDADQGHPEEECDENNNLPTSKGAVEIIDLKKMDLPPYDAHQAAEVSGSDVEEGHPVTTSLTVQVESRGDSQKCHQIINSSSSQMKRIPSTTIIDASDGEECDSDADVEPTLSFAAEQEAAAGAEEKFKQSLESSLLEPEIERTLSLPQWSVEDDPGSLKDLAQAEAVQVVDKLMAEDECREDKEEILARLQSANLLHLAIDPESSQVVQAAVFAVSQDRDLQPSLIRNLAVHLPTLAIHPDGYLVILAALDAATSDERIRFTCWLEDEAVVLSLLGSKVGAFIVRRMMEWGLDPLTKGRLIWVLLPHVQDLATTASAMWVLQRLLVEEDSLGIGERELANALISNTSLDKLVNDPLGCDLLMKAVPMRQGALAPRAASWILRNTSIDTFHAAQFAAVVRQLLVEGRNPDSQFMLDRWIALEEESNSEDCHPLLKSATKCRQYA